MATPPPVEAADPSGTAPRARLLVFYDGGCPLCHRAVAFLARRPAASRALLFAPLGGARFRETIPDSQVPSLPDSLVVVDDEGRLRTRSAAVLRALQALGGGWAALAALATTLPVPLRDRLYDGVARSRHRLGTTGSSCPAVPAAQRALFDLRP